MPSIQLKSKAEENSKEREVLKKCVSITDIKNYKLLHMTKTFKSKEKHNKSILTSDPEVRSQKIRNLFERDDVSRKCQHKADLLSSSKCQKTLTRHFINNQIFFF